MVKIFHLSFSFIFLPFAFSASAYSKPDSFESPEDFTYGFIQTVFESENKNNPPLFFDEVKEYFDFRVIGRSLLGRGYRSFSPQEFNNFVRVFPAFEVRKMFSHLKGIEGEDIDFIFLHQSESEKNYGFLYKIDYRYKRSGSAASSDIKMGKVSFFVVKMKDKDHYKMINLSLDGINWLIQRRKYYSGLIENRKGPAEIVNILALKQQ